MSADGTKFSIELYEENATALKVFLQIGNRIYWNTLQGGGDSTELTFTYNGSVVVPSGDALKTFKVFGNAIWAECGDEEGGSGPGRIFIHHTKMSPLFVDPNQSETSFFMTYAQNISLKKFDRTVLLRSFNILCVGDKKSSSLIGWDQQMH